MSYKKMMSRAVRKAQANAWEHDGTNLRGISSLCEVCQKPLIRASENGTCGPCLAVIKDRIEIGIAKTFRKFNGGGGS